MAQHKALILFKLNSHAKMASDTLASGSHFLFAPLLPNLREERRKWGWLPLAPVAPQGFVAGSRAFRAPLQPDGLAV